MAFERCEVCGARTLRHPLCSRHRPVRERLRITSSETRARDLARKRRNRAAYGVRDELLMCGT